MWSLKIQSHDIAKKFNTEETRKKEQKASMMALEPKIGPLLWLFCFILIYLITRALTRAFSYTLWAERTVVILVVLLLWKSHEMDSCSYRNKMIVEPLRCTIAVGAFPRPGLYSLAIFPSKRDFTMTLQYNPYSRTLPMVSKEWILPDCSYKDGKDLMCFLDAALKFQFNCGCLGIT